MQIAPTPLLRLLLEGLKDLGDVVAPELMGDVHQNLLSHLKLNLAGSPDRRIKEVLLAAVVQPIMQEVEKVQTKIWRKKIWRDVILPCGATLLLLLLGWALKLGKRYAMTKYVERYRRRNEETAATAAMQLNSVNTAQEEGVVQQ